MTIADTVTGTSVVCTATAAAGRFKPGTGLSGTGIGSLRSLSLTGCVTTGRLAFTAIADGLPWSLNAGKYIPAKATTDDTLYVYVTSGCTGVFTNGDPVTVDNAYLLSPAQTITSP